MVFARFPSISALAAAAALAAAVVAAQASAAAAAPQQPAAVITPAAAPGYAAMADLVVASPLVVDATIRSESRIGGAEAATVAAGQARVYVEADVAQLIRGDAAIPARVGWLLDVPLDPRGRPPRLKKQRVLIFARPVAGRSDQVQLVSPGAQLAWSAPTESLARRIAAEVNAPDAPPVVTGVGAAFHVAGSLPGEGETQIFLQTRGDRPAALSVLRRPGEAPRFVVALGEIIDDGAAAPVRDTLLWYRLACALPAALPDHSVAALEPGDADRARADYRFVVDQLGPCRNGTVAAR